MQDTELSLSLAEIAGVLVGFGALIAVRSAGPANVVEVASIGWVVLLATVVVPSALAPVVLGRFSVDSHGLWLPCSVVALAGGAPRPATQPFGRVARTRARLPSGSRRRPARRVPSWIGGRL